MKLQLVQKVNFSGNGQNLNTELVNRKLIHFARCSSSPPGTIQRKIFPFPSEISDVFVPKAGNLSPSYVCQIQQTNPAVAGFYFSM